MNINPQSSKRYCTHTETVLTTALNYLSRGWSVIPLVYKGKEAGRFRWKRFQTERISEAELRMLLPKKLYNLGIVLGDVSNGLVVRDFDISEAYDQWKKDRPDLAASLPTVATSRGYHVYARMVPGTKTQKYKDGELRANGGYVVAPPSVHPDGRRYQWVNSFRGDSELPILCRDDFIVNAVSGDTETAEPIETAKPIELAKPTEDIKANECHKEEVIQNAILASIPTQPGQREKKLFEFARRLLGVIGPDAEPAVVTLYFDRWWILAEEIVATKDYGTSLSAFLRGYANARIAYGETMNQILLIATQKPKLEWVPAKCDPKTFALAALCRELQLANGSEPFFLLTHVAAKLLNVPPMTVWRWMGMFESLKKIKTIEKGLRGGKRATRYRYVADDI